MRMDLEPPEEPREKIKSTDVKESHAVDVIRNIKKPVVIEEKKEKIKRRPRVIGSEPRTLNTGLMNQAEVPASFKKPEEKMCKYEREQNARASQDRKNVVLDHLGNADQAWEYLLDRNAGKRSFAGYFEKDGTPRTIFTDGKVKTVTREEKRLAQILLSSLLTKRVRMEVFFSLNIMTCRTKHIHSRCLLSMRQQLLLNKKLP